MIADLELVRLLPEGEIRFKLLENHWVQILADRKTYKMVGMAKDNFPAIPEFPHPLVKIPAKILSSLIAKTAFAISNEESRYTLNGALLLLKPDTIAMVATDGHRLAVAEIDHKFAGLTREVRPLVPKKALTEVQRLASEAGEDGQIELDAKRSTNWSRILRLGDHASGRARSAAGRPASGAACARRAPLSSASLVRPRQVARPSDPPTGDALRPAEPLLPVELPAAAAGRRGSAAVPTFRSLSALL
jgi:hypothetical protein